MEGTLFNIFAGLTVLSALLVVANPFSRNPVTSALFLVTTMISISGLFVLLGAYFLAAVQILVYAGAVMVLFLFVIMLLGVDRAENLGVEPIVGQRPLAAVIGASLMGMLLTLLLVATDGPTGAPGRTAPLGDAGDNTRRLGEALFTGHVFAVELTALLLTVAVVGAVVLARTVKGPMQPLPVVVVATSTEPADADAGPDTAADEESEEAGGA